MILNIYVNRDYFLCTALFFSLKSKKYHVYTITRVCSYYIIVLPSGRGLDPHGAGWPLNVLRHHSTNGGQTIPSPHF